MLEFKPEESSVPSCQKILMINIHSIMNAGDAALTLVAIQQLEKEFPEAQISLSMNDPHYVKENILIHRSFFAWIKNGSKWNYLRLIQFYPSVLLSVLCFRIFQTNITWMVPQPIRGLIKSYMEADMVVSIPGGFFYSSGKGITLSITSISLALALIAGKPLYILPQSIGPFRYNWEKTIARWIFGHARIVMVREDISKKQLEDCGVTSSKITTVPDLAFGFNGSPLDETQNWFRENQLELEGNQAYLGLTVIDWGAQNREFVHQDAYEQSIAAAVRFFIENHQGLAIFLPQCWGPSQFEDDRIPAKRIAQRLSDLVDQIRVIEAPIPTALLKSVFGQMNFLIGTRMHSNIFAVSQGVPIIAIGYLHKTEGIAKMVGIENWVIDIQEINPELLVAKVKELLDQQTEIRTHLNKRMPLLVKESGLGGVLIAQDFISQSKRASSNRQRK